MTLDGVMQAPGEPDEDASGGFNMAVGLFPFFYDYMSREIGG